MVLNIKITDTDYICINYNLSNYKQWSDLCDVNNDNDCVKILDGILYDISSNRIYYGKPLITPNNTRYSTEIIGYFYIMNRIKNPIIYNEYLDKFINKHKHNLYIQELYKDVGVVKPKRRGSKPKFKDEYVRFETTDVFTGETVYEYVNYKTKDIKYSSNPDLLEELNTAIKRKTKTKNNTYKNNKVIGGLSFNFKMTNK